MAAAKLVGGQPALYAVVPIAGGLLVLATFGIGRRLASPGAGLIGAILVATSPAFLFMLVWPMTDVPVAAAWAIAFYFLLGSSRASIVGAGLAASIAILIRPNLVFLGASDGRVVPGAPRAPPWALSPGPRASQRRSSTPRSSRWPSSPGIVATALINNYLYGSPMKSGYVGVEGMFSTVARAGRTSSCTSAGSPSRRPCSRFSARWRSCVPARRLWPAAPDRRVFAVIGLFVALLWAHYFAYLVFENWWYLRFLLASWPFIMVGCGALVMAVVRMRQPVASARRGARRRAARVASTCAPAIDRSAFELWQGERRYVSIGKLVGMLTEPNSVIFSMQHSGSLRYYAGRMSLRFDNLDRDWLDRAVSWLEAHGVQSYLLVEEWEEPEFKKQFAGSARLEHLDMPPIFTYDGPAKIKLFDLTRLRPRENQGAAHPRDLPRTAQRAAGAAADADVHSLSMRRPIRELSFTLAVIGCAWTIWLVVVGGVDTTLFGVTITSNEPIRPFLLATLGFAAVHLERSRTRSSLALGPGDRRRDSTIASSPACWPRASRWRASRMDRSSPSAPTPTAT